MKSGGLKSQGFTIVEIMIFLAVSGAIMISALRMVSGAQNKNEFIVAVNDIEQQINGIINNVSTGYYANVGNFTNGYTCEKSMGAPKFTNAPGKQGTNQQCIFVGRMIQFGADALVPGTRPNKYVTYNIVGIRQDASGNQITSPAEARPLLIAPEAPPPTRPERANFPDAREEDYLRNGLEMKWGFYARYEASGAVIKERSVGAVAFFSSLNGGAAASPDIKSGSLQVDVMPFFNIWSFVSSDAAIKQFNSTDFADTTYGFDAVKNPREGVLLCFNSGGTDQHALLTIGGSAGQSVVTKQISSGKCPDVSTL